MLSAKLGGKFDKYIMKFVPKGVSPNICTLLGLGITGIAGFFLAVGLFKIGGVFIFLAGFCDMADGAIARSTGRVSQFGGFLDSVIDRYADLLIFFGLCFYYYFNHNLFLFLCALLVIAGSLLTSYTRARAEVFLGQRCNVGLIERPERIILLGIGALFNILNYILPVLALLSNITVFQRIYFVWRKTALPKKG
ncbi:MAG: CDP-alcohol phosphatidyltransferase family protein [Candidatus Desulfofervidaceae bacterium]|nr:CDP-alcohol phosphatidyltransferase family protein [Candidatus Desulfofervidaceae bacterium]MDL1970401.1 CDP-alcohol phosphatidyltransferase family protein [Candidatus Desulfofervidaceae bacterium]